MLTRTIAGLARRDRDSAEPRRPAISIGYQPAQQSALGFGDKDELSADLYK
jgi:hypothetical protein